MNYYTQSNVPKNPDGVRSLRYSFEYESYRESANIQFSNVFHYTDLQHLELAGIRSEDGDLEQLTQLKKLQTLTFRNLKGIQIPDSIAELPFLRSIQFIDCDRQLLPSTIGQIEGLEVLTIKNAGLTTIPDYVFQLADLSSVNFANNQIEKAPNQLVKLKKLRHLYLENNQIEYIPDIFDQFPEFVLLLIHNNQLKQCPASLSSCPKLYRFTWLGNPFGDLPAELFQLPLEVLTPNYYEKEQQATAKEVIQHIKTIDADLLAATQLRQLAAIYNREEEYIQKEMNTKDLLGLLQLTKRGFNEKVLHAIDFRGATELEKHPIKAGSTVFITGKTTLKKSELRQQLKEYGVDYSAKYSDQVTHVVVGKNAKNIDEFAKQQLIVIGEKCLQDYLHSQETPFLLEKSEEQSLDVAHVSALLLSQDMDNAALGVELLKGGGVPQELITELFIVAKFSDDKALSKKAKKLLDLNAPPEVLKAAKNRKKIKDFYSLEIVIRDTQLEVWKIVQYLCRKDFKSWNGSVDWALKGAPEASQKDFIVEFIGKKTNEDSHYNKKGTFDLGRDYTDLGFANYLYDVLAITNLRVWMNRLLTTLPDGISAMSNLKILQINESALQTLPKDFGQLSLEELMLSHNDFENWEAEISKLNQISSLINLHLGVPPHVDLTVLDKKLPLQKLSLEVGKNIRIGAKNDPPSPTVFEAIKKYPALKQLSLLANIHLLPETFFNSLKQLEELIIRSTSVYALPKGIDQLKKLQKLTLIGLDGPLPEGLQHCKSLEYLEIKGNMQAIPEWLSSLNSLTTLSLVEADIKDTDQFIAILQQIPALERLDIHIQDTFFDKNFNAKLLDTKLPGIRIGKRSR